MAHTLLKYTLLLVTLILAAGTFSLVANGHFGLAVLVGILTAGAYRELRAILGSDF